MLMSGQCVLYPPRTELHARTPPFKSKAFIFFTPEAKIMLTLKMTDDLLLQVPSVALISSDLKTTRESSIPGEVCRSMRRCSPNVQTTPSNIISRIFIDGIANRIHGW